MLALSLADHCAPHCSCRNVFGRFRYPQDFETLKISSVVQPSAPDCTGGICPCRAEIVAGSAFRTGMEIMSNEWTGPEAWCAAASPGRDRSQWIHDRTAPGVFPGTWERPPEAGSEGRHDAPATWATLHRVRPDSRWLAADGGSSPASGGLRSCAAVWPLPVGLRSRRTRRPAPTGLP